MALLSEHIENFLAYAAKERRFSECTVRTYRESLAKYLQCFRSEPDLEDFSQESIREFIWKMRKEEQLQVSSIDLHIACLKSFGHYLVRSHLVERNPAETVPMLKRPKRLVSFLSQKELAKDRFPEISSPTLPMVRARFSNSSTVRAFEFRNARASPGCAWIFQTVPSAFSARGKRSGSCR